MPDLTRQEKTILLFLSFSFVIGLGVSAYQKLHQRPRLSIEPFELINSREQADQIITRHSYVNINSAEVSEITRLDGIGEKLAARIIAYRQAHGPFSKKEELLRVNGIGAKKFELIKDSIILE